MQTHYETLAVSSEATTDEIKAAYRRLLRAHHPDLVGSSPESEATTRLLTEAYDTLSGTARIDYDRSLLAEEPETDPEPEPQPVRPQPHPRTPSQPSVVFSPTRYKFFSRTAIISGLLTIAATSAAFWFLFAGPEIPLRPVVGLTALLPATIAVMRRVPWPLLLVIGLGSMAFPLYLAGVWPGTALVDDAGTPVWVLALIPAHAVVALAFRLTVRPAWAQRKVKPRGR